MDHLSKIPFGRVSSLDDLDKINAMPRRARSEGILLIDLPPDDQLYLEALKTDEDNASSDNNAESTNGTTWSPMAHSPSLSNRIKLKPTNTITLSLEAISYIRPSWTLSKGMKSRQRVALEGPEVEDNETRKSDSKYMYLFFLMTLIVISVTILTTYCINRKREQDKTLRSRLNVVPSARLMEIYGHLAGHDEFSQLETILKVNFGQGIPKDLKSERCTCELYTQQTRRYNPNVTDDPYECFSCLEWSTRANLRIMVEKRPEAQSYCYHMKWQSYDSLHTPLVDCFQMEEDESWFGLGDVKNPIWELNKMGHVNRTPLISNLTSEFYRFTKSVSADPNQLVFGSWVDLSLTSSKGLRISSLKTDFDTSIQIQRDPVTNKNMICLLASCSERCDQIWSRADDLEQLRYKNNFMEYSICSAKDFMSHAKELLANSTRSLARSARIIKQKTRQASKSDTDTKAKTPTNNSTNTVSKDPKDWRLPNDIDFVGSILFTTSIEFMPKLTQETMSRYTAAASSLTFGLPGIVLVDSRWETYPGSLKMNTQSFPNFKNFYFTNVRGLNLRLVLTVKPYTDTGIGLNGINQMLDSGRIYAINYKGDMTGMWNAWQQIMSTSSSSSSPMPTQFGRTQVVRRESLFRFKNQTIEIGPRIKTPLLTICKESQDGYCAIIDLSQAQNRDWLVSSIMRSELLTSQVDGIQLAGACPDNLDWVDFCRNGVSELAKTLLFKEKLYTIPKWTGDFGYIQLAPRGYSWDDMRSVFNSVLNLGLQGFSLIHPGSVWGDLELNSSSSSYTDEHGHETVYEYLKNRHIPKDKELDSTIDRELRVNENNYGQYRAKASMSPERSELELAYRWLQLAIFMPILQFNNLAPIKRYNLNNYLIKLMKIRRDIVVPEIKKNLPFTPMLGLNVVKAGNLSAGDLYNLEVQTPLVKPMWIQDKAITMIVPNQFSIGHDLIFAPILEPGQLFRNIYLPAGFWVDPIRKVDLFGGRWYLDYKVPLEKVPYFVRSKVLVLAAGGRERIIV